MTEHEACIVCGESAALTSITVAGEPTHLCAPHARMLKKGVRAFASLAELHAIPGLDRRVEVDRRRVDRRMFPPRPETRRRNHGRRAEDPRS